MLSLDKSPWMIAFGLGLGGKVSVDMQKGKLRETARGMLKQKEWGSTQGHWNLVEMHHWIMKGNKVKVLGYGQLDFQAKKFEL